MAGHLFARNAGNLDNYATRLKDPLCIFYVV